MAHAKNDDDDEHKTAKGKRSKSEAWSPDDVQEEGVDPATGGAPAVIRSETLPVAAKRPPGAQGGEPVGHARHAETPEEVEKIQAFEHAKIPPAGSRNFVAGQPVNEEEYAATEEEANRLAEAGRRQRTEAEQRMKENTPGDPDYHPVDPDHPEPSKKRG